MRATLAVTPAIALALTTVARADPSQYLCVVEQAAGLHYEKQTDAWGPQGFPPGRKYVLRRLTEDDLKGKYQDLLTDMKLAESNWGLFRESASDHLPVAACVEQNVVIDNTNIPSSTATPSSLPAWSSTKSPGDSWLPIIPAISAKVFGSRSAESILKDTETLL